MYVWVPCSKIPELGKIERVSRVRVGAMKQMAKSLLIVRGIPCTCGTGVNATPDSGVVRGYPVYVWVPLCNFPSSGILHRLSRARVEQVTPCYQLCLLGPSEMVRSYLPNWLYLLMWIACGTWRKTGCFETIKHAPWYSLSFLVSGSYCDLLLKC